jgi:ABC-type transport system involved in multi-copper enzyme maturation permease subunit
LTQFARLFHVELIKLLRHRLTWAVLVGLLLIMGLQLNGLYREVTADPNLLATLNQYQQTSIPPLAPATPTATTPESRGELLDAALGAEAIQPVHRLANIVLPGVFNRVQLMADWLAVTMILFGILVIGHELNWGTLRTVLVRGVSRWQLLTAKLGAVTAVAATLLLLLWLACGLIGLGTTRQLSGTVDFDFATGSFWLAQLGMLARIWLVVLVFLAFTLAINIWLNKPGPAFSLLFLSYGLSWFAYISSTVAAVFVLANPKVDITNFKNSLGGWLISLLPHYNGRLVTYWQQPPHILSEFDTSVYAFAQAFGLSQDPHRALLILLLYGFIPFQLALYTFQQREITH